MNTCHLILLNTYHLALLKDEPYGFDQGYLSHYYRLAQMMLSLPSLCGCEINMDMEFEFGFLEGSPFDGASH